MNPDLFSSKSLLNLGVFTTLLLGSVWWIQSPLKSSRPRDPQTTKLIDASFPTEKPYSRPWQDPFEPYFDQAQLREGGGKGVDIKSHKAGLKKIFVKDYKKQIRKELEKASGTGKLLLMGIMVPGGPFEDRTERRQRIRVALASAMAAGGYAPDDSEHLGSFPLELNNPERPFMVPYEWFTRLGENERRHRSFPSAYDHILVFWISDDHFAEKPLLFLHKLRTQVEDAINPPSARSNGGLERREHRFVHIRDENNDFTFDYKSLLTHIKTKTPLQNEKQTEIKVDCLTNTDFFIFGPWSSTTLKKLLGEAENIKDVENGPYKDVVKSRLSFFNVFSTAPPELLLNKQDILSDDALDEIHDSLSVLLKKEDKKDKEKMRGVFRYTTCPDSDLAAAMKGELLRRGVNLKTDPIAFIAENDTVYGRSLPKTFRETFVGKNEPANIERFTYLRGLDGRVPQENPKSESAGPSNPGSSGVNARTSIESRFMPTRKTNRSEGNNQFDYIIRLGEEMKQMEIQKGRPFKVIGVLGSDLYDKLLLLQALRPQFPNALFFTTDLDASYSHPQELEWTKNLLVASTHGLTLSEDYQCGAAPFRFSYQTAVFQAILGATTLTDKKMLKRSMNDPLLKESSARLFEIGWDGPHDLYDDKLAWDANQGPVARFLMRCQNFAGWFVESVDSDWRWFYSDSSAILKGDTHPTRPVMAPGVVQRILTRFVCVSLVVFASLFVLGWHRKVFRVPGFIWECTLLPLIDKRKAAPSQRPVGQRRKQSTKLTDLQSNESPAASPLLPPPWVLASLLILALIGLAGYIWIACHDINEPWHWGSGISVWPSTTLRLIAGAVSLMLVVLAFVKAKKMFAVLCKHFKLNPFNAGILFSPKSLFVGVGKVFKMIRDLACPRKKQEKDQEDTSDAPPKKIGELWKELEEELPARFILDTIIWVGVWITVLCLLFCEGNGHLPFRSETSYNIGWIVWAVSWGATILLVFTTFFMTRSCCRFIDKMMKVTVEWSSQEEKEKKKEKMEKEETVLTGFAKRWGLEKKHDEMPAENYEGKHIENLVDVYFVEAWTGKISNLVLYPIASLILLFCAESAYFENYGSNPYRYLVMGFMGLMIFAPAFQLRGKARKLRAQKIRKTREYLEFHCADGEAVRKKIECAIKETENLKDGAFEPFLEHPFMQAILFLLGGITLPAFLSLTNRPF